MSLYCNHSQTYRCCKKIFDPGVIVSHGKRLLLKYIGSFCQWKQIHPISVAHCSHGLCSPLNCVSEWPPGRCKGVIDSLISTQPTVQPGSSWSPEQLHAVLRPVRTSRKFSVRDQAMLLTWQSLQPIWFHQLGGGSLTSAHVGMCADQSSVLCSPDGWPDPSWFLVNWTYLNPSFSRCYDISFWNTHTPCASNQLP